MPVNYASSKQGAINDNRINDYYDHHNSIVAIDKGVRKVQDKEDETLSHECSERLIDSVLHRLEIIEEIEVLTSSDLLHRYDHVWHNAHWFEGIQTIYPINNKEENPNNDVNNREMNGRRMMKGCRMKDCLSSERLTGVKMMQESLLLYKLETDEFFASMKGAGKSSMISTSSVSSSLIESIAMIDICSRLLAAAQRDSTKIIMRNDLQAVLETKSLFAFLSPNEICLLRSPRTLRTALWEIGLRFSSVFGHSSDQDPNINLDHHDMQTVSDPRANFPGCVKWRQLLDSDGLPSRSKSALDRMRDFLFFNGPDEVIPFLELMIQDLNQIGGDGTPTSTRRPPSGNDHSTRSSISGDSHDNTAMNNDQSVQQSSNNSNNVDVPPLSSLHTNNPSATAISSNRLFDSLGVKRLLANFSFRGSQLSIPTVIWNSPIGHNKYSLKLLAPMIPSTLNQFMRGTQTLMSSHYYRMNFKLSESSSQSWQPIQHHTNNMSNNALSNNPILLDLKFRCPDVTDKILSRQPLEEFTQNINNIAKVTPLSNTTHSLSKSNPLSSLETSSSSISTAIVPLQPSTSNSLLPVVNHQDNSCAELIEASNSEMKTTSATLGNQTVSEMKGPPKRVRRRVGPAPSMLRTQTGKNGIRLPGLSKALSKSTEPFSSSLASTHRIQVLRQRQDRPTGSSSSSINVLSYLRPADRLSVHSIQNCLVCLIGQFPFAPLTGSIQSDQLISINSQFFDQIHFFVTSSSTSIQNLLSITPHIQTHKLRTHFWFSLSLQHNQIILDHEDNQQKSSVSSSASTAIQIYDPLKNPFHQSHTKNIINTIHRCGFTPPPNCPLYRPFHDDLHKNSDDRSGATGVSRSLFMMVPNPIIADLAAPLVRQELRMNRILLMNQSRPVKKWVMQIQEKQRRWEHAIIEKMQKFKTRMMDESTESIGAECDTRSESHNDGNEDCAMMDCEDVRLNELCDAMKANCPNFKVHVIVILPYWNHQHEGNEDINCERGSIEVGYCESVVEEMEKRRRDRSVDVYNELIHADSNWEEIRKGLNDLSTLQQQTMAHSPIELIDQWKQNIRDELKNRKRITSSLDTADCRRTDGEITPGDKKGDRNCNDIVIRVEERNQSSISSSLLSSSLMNCSEQQSLDLLMVSIVPMDFVDSCYKECGIDMDALLRLRVLWNSIEERFFDGDFGTIGKQNNDENDNHKDGSARERSQSAEYVHCNSEQSGSHGDDEQQQGISIIDDSIDKGVHRHQHDKSSDNVDGVNPSVSSKMEQQPQSKRPSRHNSTKKRSRSPTPIRTSTAEPEYQDLSHSIDQIDDGTTNDFGRCYRNGSNNETTHDEVQHWASRVKRPRR